MSIGSVYSLIKTADGKWAPGDRDAKEKTDRFGAGEFAMVTLRKPRNIKFHRKMFAMFQLAFAHWNPSEQYVDGIPARKSFDRLRKDLTIAAGYWELELGLDGTAHLEAKSLRFDAMDDLEFEECYAAVFAVLSAGLLQGMTRAQAEALAQQVYDGGF